MIHFPVLEITEGAKALAASDPHGWTLTLISVSVVFGALIILYIIYTLLGGFMSGAFKEKWEKRRKSRPSAASPDAETAAAIALALSLEGGENETAAAIAVALELARLDEAHDAESYVITFAHPCGPWADKRATFRKYPKK